MVIARDQITLSWQLDVQGTVYYYKKQSSTATAPEKPTSYPPSGWTTTEPGYSSGETSTLYVTVCTLYDNGSFEYSDVSVSASFEAAKEAYNKAVAAQTAASNAITAANGKTKIFYQNDAPTAGMVVGDMWFDTDGGNAVYQYTSSGWVLRQYGQGALAANSVTAVEINVASLSAIAANIGTVTAGKLQSSDYSYTSGIYTTAGMIVDLDGKVVRMPNTAILSDGSLHTKSGEIGGFILEATRLYSPVTVNGVTYRANMQSMGNSTDPARLAFYVAIDQNGATTYPFRVNYNGTLYASDLQATGGTIGGWTIGNTDLHNGKTALASGNGSGVYVGSDGIGTSDGTYGNLSISADGTVTLENLTSTRNYAKIKIVGGPGYNNSPGFAELLYTGLFIKHQDYNYSFTDVYCSKVGGGRIDLYGLANGVTPTISLRGENGSGNPTISLRAFGVNGNTPATSGGEIEFCYNSSSATSSIKETASGRLTVSGALNALTLGSGNKTAYNDGNAGVWLQSVGNIDISHASGGSLQFHYANAANATSRIYESASGALTSSAPFFSPDHAGNSRRMVGSQTSDGGRVAYLGTNATILSVNAQHGATGTTYSNKSITFSSSDIRLKDNVRNTSVNALDLINRIPIREFDWTDGRPDKHQVIGMVADEIERLDSRLSVGGGYTKEGGMNIKSVNTFYLVGYLVKAIQELSEEVKILKGAA